MPCADKNLRLNLKTSRSEFTPFNLIASSPNLAKISAKAANLRADFRLFASFTRVVAEIKKPKVEKEVKGKAWR